MSSDNTLDHSHKTRNLPPTEFVIPGVQTNHSSSAAAAAAASSTSRRPREVIAPLQPRILSRAHMAAPVSLVTSASKSSIQRFVITRAFSWLKAATTAFKFKTLLRHYAKRALTPRSLNLKLGPRHKGHKGWAVWLAWCLIAACAL